MRVAIELYGIGLSVVVAAFCCGCTSEGSESNEPSATVDETLDEATNDAWLVATEGGCRHDRMPFRVVTFNAALAPGFEPLAMERAPKVVEALADVARNADLMCIQEFWLPSHFESLRASTSELPYVLRMDPRPGSGNCTMDELAPLVSCLSSSCPDASGEQTVGCAKTVCASPVTALSGGCLGCIMNHLDDLSECLGDGQAPSDPAVFGGAFDVALLSRWPIRHSGSLELSSYFVRASVIHARVAVPTLGGVDVFCTHLGSALGIVPYAGAYGSWEGEHQRQTEELLQYVRQQNRGRRPALILGDFNSGPAAGINQPAWSGHYQMILGAGFDDAYVTGKEPLCTSCAGTTFRDSSSSNEIIDHVFSARLSTRRLKSERLFVEPVELGPTLPLFNLSDHVGLRLTFEGRR